MRHKQVKFIIQMQGNRAKVIRTEGTSPLNGPNAAKRSSLPGIAPSYWHAKWAKLHVWAFNAEPGPGRLAWMAEFTNSLPCGECKAHWQFLLRTHPVPEYEPLFKWSVDRHNDVNRRLHKREVSYPEALHKWSPSSVLLGG